MNSCRACGAELTEENWYPSCKHEHRNICKPCQLKRCAKWSKEHHYVSTRHYEYVKKWKKSHPEKMKEYSRLENHRRRRRLSTKTVLNYWFVGSHLHHLTPDEAIYIPAELHRRIRHNLVTGFGMKEINSKVLAWVEAL